MPVLTNGDIRKALGKLNGCTFSDREELENAIYPLFGPLQAFLPGQTFRDLTDILVGKGWVVIENESYVVKFPPESDLTVKAPASSVPKTTLTRHNLTFREIALMVFLRSVGDTGKNGGNLQMYDEGMWDSLMGMGLVEHINIHERDGEYADIEKNMLRAKTDAVAAIMAGDYATAGELCDDLYQTERDLNLENWVYRLTRAGRIFMEDQPDCIVIQWR